MGRLPTTADFADGVKVAIVPPPPGDPATNVLILLHGLGDSHESFARLAQQMKLPETVGVSIRGPQPLLDLGGAHWGDDVLFDSSSAGLDPDAGFTQTTELLNKVIQTSLVDKCGYKPREIVLFGFGQGGMAALNAAVDLHQRTKAELGGVISIGGSLPSTAPSTLSPKCPTPVLVCAGSSESAVTSASEDKLKRVFEFVQIKRYRRPGDRMPSNRDEMVPVMQFFSRRLRSTKGVPKGSVEIG